ncbi:proline dehydrogenase family protein [Patescibacteria group bacterium AH-259-L05]|nr:proline dehydrogenase family protein [Patescibacteria group bacterium AH-259-L05]
MLRFLARILKYFPGYVAGATAKEAINVVKGLNKKGIRAQINILDEEVTSVAHAQKAAQEYCHLLDNINAHQLDACISVKLTHLGLSLPEKGREVCVSNMHQILKKARSFSMFVWVDMESSEYNQTILDMVLELNTYYDNMGLAMQAALFKSRKDVALLCKRQIPIRLCKGAYVELKHISHQSKKDISNSFKDLIVFVLLRGRSPAIATSADEEIIEFTKHMVGKYKILKSLFEFQMLLGRRKSLQKRLVKQGYQVRVYVPYGVHYLPYIKRRLMEIKRNLTQL